MNAREDVAGLTRPFCHRLSAMIQSGLLKRSEYVPWAESLIGRLEQAPTWLQNLTTTKYRPDPSKLLLAVAFASEHGEEGLSWDTWVDDFVASLYLRYDRREISWFTFLESAGAQADANGGRHPCEYFYSFLNEYEDAAFSATVERRQQNELIGEYEGLIKSIRTVLDTIAAHRTSRK